MVETPQCAPQSKPRWSTPKLELLVPLDEAEGGEIAAVSEATSGTSIGPPS